MRHPVLVLLRWPKDTPRESAPACACLARLWNDWRCDEIALTAWLPNGTAGAVDAEAASGSMAIMLWEFNAGVDESESRELEAFFGGGPQLCRYETVHGISTSRPCSSATLVYVDEALTVHDGEDLGALQDARAIEILRGLEAGGEALRDLFAGDGSKQDRRRLNSVLRNVRLALHAAEQGGAGSVLNRPIGTMRTLASMARAFGIGGEGDMSNIGSFADFLQSGEALSQAPYLRPGFGDPMMRTATALRALVHHGA